MIIKKFKLFEELDPWSRRKLNINIKYERIRQDINGILVELKDIGYNISVSSNEESYDYFGINISKGKNLQTNETGIIAFNISDIKDYLDTCVDYMDLYYNYKIEVKYIQNFSGREEEYDNYELHLDKRVKSFILIFYDITVK